MAVRAAQDLSAAAKTIDKIKRYAEEAGRDPEKLGFQCQVSPPPQQGSNATRDLYSHPRRVAQAVARLREAGFGGAAINGTGLFQAGARSADEMIEALGKLHDAIRNEVGR